MSAHSWVTIGIAGAALAVSAISALWQYTYRRREDRRAHVNVSFYWLPNRARVVVPGRDPIDVGYHIVLSNRGPAQARNVNLAVLDGAKQPVTLLDLGSDELPLAVLDAGSQYPIPWAIEPFVPHARRYEVEIRWDDDAAPNQSVVVPLRRGQLPPI